LTLFTDFGLARPILDALSEEAHTVPTPIQAQAIPPVLSGRDLLGIAQTGTGKTAAFALPILHRLAENAKATQSRSCRVLVLSPTRELSSQIRERFQAYGRHLPLKSEIVIGGVGMGGQIRALSRGTDILIATPGRLIDLMGQGAIRVDQVEILVLDEADRMLDMGFIHAIRKIAAKLPRNRQSLFFSATMPTTIAGLAGSLLRDPVTVSVSPPKQTVDKVAQHVIHVPHGGKLTTLRGILSKPEVTRSIVFARTKRGADRVARGLVEFGIPADALHGNKSQGQRERALDGFRTGETAILVATDIAARGIDVADISHVVNYDLPNEPESYVHRIGRTARAGAEGIAISLVEGGEERGYLRSIEKLIRQSIPVMDTPVLGQPLQKAEWAPRADAEAPAAERTHRPHRHNGVPRKDAEAPGAKRIARPHRHNGRSQSAPHKGMAGVSFMHKAHAEQNRPAQRPAAPARQAAGGEAERNENGKGRTPRIRRRRNRGAPGRELSRQAG
jgi:superfamily II DNA/RNA helicase